MKQILFAALLLSACGESPDQNWKDFQQQADEGGRKQALSLEAAVKKGDLILTREYYRPNLADDRWFKVGDQYGCKWWINSGHKFDNEQLDIREDGEANCPNAKDAPPKEYIYRDRTGNIIDPSDYRKASTP